MLVGLVLYIYWRQRYGVHTDGAGDSGPDYPRVELTQETDYETFFRQTGLGKSAVDKLLETGEFQTILEIQEAFFQPTKIVCTPLLGWFTREDRLVGESISRRSRCRETKWSEAGQENYVSGPVFADLQPGDIILTLSTHSLGWRHGHAGLVIDEDTTLECAVLGTDSDYGDPQDWCEYSNYCVLRVKNVTPRQQEAVAAYACNELHGVPYHLTAGFIGEKAPETDARQFGLQCAYLVWYAWYQFGYDLDADGGRLVSAYDLLTSEQLEVAQMYGMNPEIFDNNKTE